jgi:putative ABC transport system permease protein
VRLILSAFVLALTAVARNKTRSALTVLGILIGVAAVVTVTALAGGASQKVGSQIEGFASNAIFISPQQVQQSGARSKSGGRLTEGDARALVREAVSIDKAAPFLSTTTQVVAGERNAATLIIGTTAPYFPVRKFNVQRGSMWTDTDELLKTKVCILGATPAEKLFGNVDPVGRIVRIGRAPYRVVGVLEARGTSPFGDDQDDRVMIPIGTYRARVQPTSPGRVDMILASATSAETTQRAQEQTTSILRQRHRIQDGRDADFTVNSQAEFQAVQAAIGAVLSALLLGVAAVSLLVGGVGVMNIMLVSVAERTREIGIRMSIGARETDILFQFLVEAVVLCLFGGVLGIAFGVSFTMGLGRALDWPLAPSASSIGIAVLTSLVIGLVFGFVPALRAARLDPVEALRTE